jgi:hypothetical protein
MIGICIPVPEIHYGHEVNITVTSGNQLYLYKMEVFEFLNKQGKSTDTIIDLFSALKSKIEHYDNSWELLQVFAPEGEKNEVKVLFRKR